MPLNVIVNEDGTRQRVSTGPLAVQRTGEVLLSFPEFDAEPSPDTHAWDAATQQYVALVPDVPEPISRTQLTKREFRARLGQSCRVQINARILTPPTTPEEVQLVASLQDMKDELLAADFVDLTHPTTVAAVNALVALGYLTSEQGTAALAPSTVASE